MILKRSKHTIKIMLQKMIASRNSKKYTNVLDHVPLVSDLKKTTNGHKITQVAQWCP